MVVLPEPDGPISATSSPRGTSKVTPSSTPRIATAKAQGLHAQYYSAHAVAFFQRRSRRRASAASGSDIAR